VGAQKAARTRTHLSVHGIAHQMSAASVCPRSAADCLIRSAVDISHPRQQGNPPASSSAASGPVRSDIISGLRAGAVGGMAILRWFLACLQASFLVLLTLILPLRRRAVVTTSLRKASASSSPSACRSSSGFDGVNEEADVRANAAFVDGHADVCAR